MASRFEQALARFRHGRHQPEADPPPAEADQEAAKPPPGRGDAFRARVEERLRILEQQTGVAYAPYRSLVVWGPLLPQDRSRLAEDEARLVEVGIHSRRRAADALGVPDPETEFAR